MTMTDHRTLRFAEGVELPKVGLGTYLMSNDQAHEAVSVAIDAGYRHVDTAEIYDNEEGVGSAIRDALEDGSLSREQLFVTTKLWPGHPGRGEPPKTAATTVDSLQASLARLSLDYVDLYLIHAPLHPGERLDQWRGLVELRERGNARAIGVSNYGAEHLEEIRAAGLPPPQANQVELHPWAQKPELVSYLADHGIAAIAYSSLVPLSTWRAQEGHKSAKTEQMVAEGERPDSPFREMAAKYGVTEAQVLLRWGVQKGYAVLPKSTKRARMRENLDLFSFAIDEDDMAAIAKMDRGASVAWASGDPTQME